jgi:hypothetical protein
MIDWRYVLWSAVKPWLVVIATLVAGLIAWVVSS